MLKLVNTYYFSSVVIACSTSYFSYMKKFKDCLSTRSINALARCLGRDALDHPEVIVAERTKLNRAVGLGEKSLKETAELLYEFGHINDIEEWLGG